MLRATVVRRRAQLNLFPPQYGKVINRENSEDWMLSQIHSLMFLGFASNIGRGMGRVLETVENSLLSSLPLNRHHG